MLKEEVREGMGGDGGRDCIITPRQREMCTISCLHQVLGPELVCTSRTSCSIASTNSVAVASVATRKRYCTDCASFSGEVIWPVKATALPERFGCNPG